jgi:DNA-directed RNA polymerase specialized sigma24 family protein
VITPTRRAASHHVYRLYADAGALLYVGNTMHPHQRLNAHRKNQPWWPEVRRIIVFEYPDYSSGVSAEAAAIASEKPRYNQTPGQGCVPGRRRRQNPYTAEHLLVRKAEARRRSARARANRSPKIGEMLALYAIGLTYEEIGAHLGISKQRVHQLLKQEPGWTARPAMRRGPLRRPAV